MLLIPQQIRQAHTNVQSFRDDNSSVNLMLQKHTTMIQMIIIKRFNHDVYRKPLLSYVFLGHSRYYVQD